MRSWSRNQFKAFFFCVRFVFWFQSQFHWVHFIILSHYRRQYHFDQGHRHLVNAFGWRIIWLRFFFLLLFLFNFFCGLCAEGNGINTYKRNSKKPRPIFGYMQKKTRCINDLQLILLRLIWLAQFCIYIWFWRKYQN